VRGGEKEMPGSTKKYTKESKIMRECYSWVGSGPGDSRDRRDNGASGDGATIVGDSWLETMRFKVRT
jgi:hypothetical protein